METCCAIIKINVLVAEKLFSKLLDIFKVLIRGNPSPYHTPKSFLFPPKLQNCCFWFLYSSGLDLLREDPVRSVLLQVSVWCTRLS